MAISKKSTKASPKKGAKKTAGKIKKAHKKVVAKHSKATKNKVKKLVKKAIAKTSKVTKKAIGKHSTKGKKKTATRLKKQTKSVMKPFTDIAVAVIDAVDNAMHSVMDASLKPKKR